MTPAARIAAVIEILTEMRASSDAGTIKRAALSNGMRTLRVDGLDKALQGHTSFDEVLRVTQEEAVELD